MANEKPTDEEQAWLEQKLEQTADEAVADAQAAAATADNNAEADYSDVMKMIEENRRKNEAKRAAQSAKNQEIERSFEQRSGM